MSIIAIIQARTSSTRLPGKVLKKIEGKAILEHIINRVKVTKNLDDLIVATTVKKEDLKIVKLCADLGISVFCGSEDDVLDRYYQTARLFKADHIIRITSDCPLIDPEIIDNVVDLHFKEGADFTTNTMPETFPDGEDVEVFTFRTLYIAWKYATLLSEREHVTPYIKNRPLIFKKANLWCKIDRNDMRWTIDEPKDLKFIRMLYKNLYYKNPLFDMEMILAFLKEHPEIEKINKGIIRNEGYLKSLLED